MTDTNLLDIAIERSGLKRSFLASAIGVTSTTFKRKCANKSEFKASEIDILCQLLHIDALEDRSAIFFKPAG